jgi:putative sterol carrier protein
MAEKFKYLSPEWRNEAERRLKTELPPERMNFVTSSMSNIYQNCPPDGSEKYLYFKFEDGKFAEMLLGEGESPKPEFAVSGDYQTFARITRGELGAQKALMTMQLKLKGNMVKALRLSSLADRLNKVLAAIPTDY